MSHAASPVKHSEPPRERRRGPHSPAPDALYPFPYPFPYFYPSSTPHSAKCTGCPWYHPPPDERAPAPQPKRLRRLPPETRLHPVEPEPSTSPTALTRLSLDPRWYPGVFGVVASHASRDTLLRLRLVSRDARDAADRILFAHVVVRRKCPRKDAAADLAILVSPRGQRLPLLPLDYSPLAPRPRMARAFKHIHIVDYPSHVVALPPTITRQLVSSVKMMRRLGWNYGALAAAQQVDVCRAPLRRSLPEALISMRDVTKRQVLVVPWNDASVGEAPYLRPRTFDLDDLAFASARRGGECVIIFRNEGEAASGAAGATVAANGSVTGAPSATATPSASSATSSPPATPASVQPFLQPVYLLVASLLRARYTLVGLEDLPRRLFKLCRDPAREPCAAKRVASLHHLVVAAVCACWNVAGDDARTVGQLAGRVRLLTRAQYAAEVGGRQYALESFDTPVAGPADALPQPADCECGGACARAEPGAQLEGDWGEIVRQVLMASAAAKQ